MKGDTQYSGGVVKTPSHAAITIRLVIRKHRWQSDRAAAVYIHTKAGYRHSVQMFRGKMDRNALVLKNAIIRNENEHISLYIELPARFKGLWTTWTIKCIFGQDDIINRI